MPPKFNLFFVPMWITKIGSTFLVALQENLWPAFRHIPVDCHIIRSHNYALHLYFFEPVFVLPSSTMNSKIYDVSSWDQLFWNFPSFLLSSTYLQADRLLSTYLPFIIYSLSLHNTKLLHLIHSSQINNISQ